MLTAELHNVVSCCTRTQTNLSAAAGTTLEIVAVAAGVAMATVVDQSVSNGGGVAADVTAVW